MLVGSGEMKEFVGEIIFVLGWVKGNIIKIWFGLKNKIEFKTAMFTCYFMNVNMDIEDGVINYT